MQPYCPECNASVVSEDMLICKVCNAVRPPFGWPLDPILNTLVDGGRYEVEKRLGAGGFGVVYQVLHTLVQQRRAMKIMDKQLVGSADVQRRFIDEWDILDKIEHPNIVRCFEIGILPETRQPFMLLELLEGVNLFDAIWPRGASHPKRFDPARAARVGWQIAAALQVAHAKGMLHRDLKPDNVLVVRDAEDREQVKVIDFGIAKILGSATVERKTSRIVGTPEYMAPEQFNPGQELDGRLDLWQLGAVLFFITTGWPPYTSEDDEDTFAIYRAMRERRGQPGPRPSASHAPMAQHPGFDALIGGLLATLPDDRPNAAQEVMETITSLFERDELADGGPPPGLDRMSGRYASVQASPQDSEMDSGAVPAIARNTEQPAVTAAPVVKLRRGAAARPAVTQNTTPPAAIQIKKPRPQTERKVPGKAAPTALLDPEPSREGAGGDTLNKRVFVLAGILGVLLIGVLAAGLIPWAELLAEKPPEPAVFAHIYPGRFEMGSVPDEPGRFENETRHEVKLTRPFMLQVTEVTQEQWQRLMGTNPSQFKDCGPECPVDSVSWWDAVEYLNRLSSEESLDRCYKLKGCRGAPGADFVCESITFEGLDCTGYRLPTEAEWEYAVRAGTLLAFPSGPLDPAQTECSPPVKHLSRTGWYCGNARSETHPVALREANSWRLHDMLGNVSEWVWDWNAGDYDAVGATDPLGPDKGAGRTYRGGSYMSLAKGCRSAARNYEEPQKRSETLGFRPARTAE